MRSGDIIGDRFEIERLVGRGGMGEIYRARDRRTGAPAALKWLRVRSIEDRTRFEREAQTLAELHHPHIVRYVAHGATPHGEPYLAMEWLDGEDLGARLSRGHLTINETIALGLRVAEALGAAHARGVVHRDLKPDNLFLPGGSIEQVKLLDFGIARLAHESSMTPSGVIFGTLGYMSPEQARGEHALDARSDVFALGCLLFECLTGTRAFAGSNVMAMLAKIVFEDVPRASTLCAGLPPRLDALVARMLAKDPSARPADGTDAASQLAALGGPEWSGRERENTYRTAITRGEQRLLGVVLSSGELTSSSAASPMLSPSEAANLRGALRIAAERYGARLEVLADGSTAATLIGTAAATDLAAQAARCALTLRELLPDRPMALAMGRGEIGTRLPIGEAIDRAAGLLRAWPATRSGDGHPIAIDEVAAGLLDARFEVTTSEAGRMLSSERDSVEGARTLLGKPTPCVGRERELAILQATFDECRSDSVARAVLVTAEAGVGKSRLRAEFLRRTRSAAVQIWEARGDPMRAGAPFELLGQLIQQTARLRAGEPLEARQQKLAARVAQRVDDARCPRVAEFLGEMVGTPFPEQNSVQLRAARQNAMLMSDQMRRAWVDFIEAECRTQPVILVLEDLHWGDLPTVEYLDTTLRLLRNQPVMVLALARPDVHELFPKLWMGRAAQELRLGQLPRHACEELVRHALGEELTSETVAKLVERSQGNAFFLEELVRAVAEGRGDEAPGTVLAMLQSRLEHLAPAARRALRAASIFGEVFWPGAVVALLDGEQAQVDALLSTLEQHEWIAPRREARFQTEREYTFQHALVREVAYGMLTGDDRVLGHRLAGAWLERVGETDAMAIAEHFDMGSEPERAVGWYSRAAEQALAGNDLGAAIVRVERSLACGARSEERGDILRLRADAHNWRGEPVEAERWALEAMDLLTEGTARWYAAAGAVAWAAGMLGHVDRLLNIGKLLDAFWFEPVSSSHMVATTWTALHLLRMGRRDRAVALYARVERLTHRFRDDPLVTAVITLGQAALHNAGDADGCRQLNEMAIQCFEQAGDQRNTCLQRANLADGMNELGAYAESVALLRVTLVDAERMGLRITMASAHSTLGFALARLGAFDEARTAIGEAMDMCAANGYQRLLGASRVYLAALLQRTGDLAGAEAEARRAVEELEVARPLQIVALATLAQVLLLRGSLAEALQPASHAAKLLESLGSIEEGESLVRLVYAEALAANGEHEAARAAIEAARGRLIALADQITAPVFRASFLENVSENARTLDLARQWSDQRSAIDLGGD